MKERNSLKENSALCRLKSMPKLEVTKENLERSRWGLVKMLHIAFM